MEIKDFLKEQGANIFTVTIILLTLIVLFKMFGVNFNPIKDSHIEKVVTIESFSSKINKYNLVSKITPESICNTQASQNPQIIHDWCGSLTPSNCTKTTCCILLDGSKCVGGNENGPTFHTENGKNVDYNYYNHKLGCFGKC